MPDKFITYITILRQRCFFLVVDIIRIDHITSYLAHKLLPVLHIFVLVVDIICIGHITSYLARNFYPIFHIYSSSANGWCITYFPVCNLFCFTVPYYFTLVRFVSEYKLNTNHICIWLVFSLYSLTNRTRVK